MNDMATLERATSPRVTVTGHAEGLATIHDAGVSAVLWQRPRPPGFDEWIAALPLDQLPSAQLTVPAAGVAEAVTACCDAAGMPDTTSRQWLIEDIAALAKRFAAILRVTDIRLKLNVIHSVTCPKFHVDAVPARLLCTYRGTGTQYGIARPGNAPAEVFDTPTGAPLLLRGKQWQDDAPTTLLHRSPSLRGGDPTRLLMVIDPAA
ncbi:DUF1826 domain-containing protein [Guyparkeria halophila]|uniref:DUF1826 domain-containing protein n=1 Tax=Guyparkeria halophila TaxID=47960 RepID=A0ABZ0YZA6_9GAMM|nr:DUF1826 domain-containing protein [Guyparkeria halophila]WQH16699.1 DUF1826 domain-containing protein [Guyparkeria halophila]